MLTAAQDGAGKGMSPDKLYAMCTEVVKQGYAAAVYVFHCHVIFSSAAGSDCF